jgi:hypothetical protein
MNTPGSFIGERASGHGYTTTGEQQYHPLGEFVVIPGLLMCPMLSAFISVRPLFWG